jgi:hypothetical protein
MHNSDITPGTKVAELIVDMEPETPIAITDTAFMSLGQMYNLTSK